jgi:ribonuclease Z
VSGPGRELVVLGTSAQTPTRERNHNGYILRWDDEVILFDPGEGAQRQLLLAGVSWASITAICITHFHGDHCLGLPGILARFALDNRETPVDIYYPETGAEFVERLRHVAVFDVWPYLRQQPLPLDATVVERGAVRLRALPLHHTIDTLGWRVEEPDSRSIVPERAAALGIEGADIGRLVRQGALDRPSGRVALEDVSELRPGQHFAFIMDTGVCDAAVELAAAADLAVCEATFLDTEQARAREYLHLTARQAGWIAAQARPRQLVLTHFSPRYPDIAPLAAEARRVFPDVTAVRDFDRVAVPPRLHGPRAAAS